MFNFNNIVVTEQVKVKAGGRVATPKNPTGMKLRLFKDGAVYPSVELADKFDLHYWAKDTQAAVQKVTYGFDVVDSRQWKQYPSDATPYIFISAVAKSEAKVDLFGSVRYNEDGTPVNSVLDQGSKRVELVEMIREVYNLNTFQPEDYPYVHDSSPVVDPLFGTKNYVDLEVHVDVTLPVSTSIFYLPKKIVKGAKAGNMDYVRRENSVFHPLTVAVDNNVEVEQEVDNNEVN